MKRCPKCGIIYSDAAEACPRCNVETIQVEEEPAVPDKDTAKKRRTDWIWIVIGVPLFILFIKWLYTIMAARLGM